MLLKRFLTTLLFSWLISPIGIFFAHWSGVAQEPILLMALLVMSACAPFQIFINEVVALRAMNNNECSECRKLLFFILSMQLVSSAITIHIQHFFLVSWLLMFGVVIATTITTLFSYSATRRYYEYSVSGLISAGKAAIFGAIPGVVGLIVYLIASVLTNFNALGMRLVLLSMIFLPTIVVWLFISFGKKTKPIVSSIARECGTTLPIGLLILLCITMVGLSILATQLRVEIVAFKMQYAAIILIGINLVASLLITVTRTNFISKLYFYTKSLFLASLIFAVVGGGIYKIYPATGIFFWFLSVQILIIYLIEFGRKISSVDSSNTSIVG